MPAQQKMVRTLIFVALLLPYVVFAQTDDFEVRMLIGDDTTPPSIPQNLTATGVATTQIDLDWDDSTDDLLLAGYHVWRDDVLIATTTNSDYQDAGLTPDTSYSYYITAFDTFFNFSASSSVATGTTLGLPPPVAPQATSDARFGSRISLFKEQVIRIEILPGRDSAVIRYETDDHIKGVVRWGETSSYELGSAGERLHGRTHETLITGLLPGRTYYFTIEGLNKLERQGVLYIGSFDTLPSEDTFPAGNVMGLTATREGDDVILTWNNPQDLDFEKVRIMRSEQFYPLDETNGWVVYQGDGTRAEDGDVALRGGRLYYTAFTYDASGNISSGAVVSIFVGEGEDVVSPPDHDPSQNEIALRFEDVLFTQDGRVIPIVEREVYVDGAKRLIVSIPYSILPEHLKTILVSIQEGEGSSKVLKFLLRANTEKTFYEATLAPLGVSGSFPVQVSVFDFKTSQVGYADGTIIAEILSFVSSTSFLDKLSASLNHLYTGWFVLLLVLLMFFTRRLLSREW